MILGTRTQTTWWKDSKTLNEHTEAVTADFFLNNMGIGGIQTEPINEPSAQTQEPNQPAIP